MTDRWINVPGSRVWTARSGVAAGPAILLSSGGPGCCDCLERVAGMIDDLATVHRWEQRGCGRSDLAGPYDLATCLSDMEALRQTFGHERWIVGGESWGANLSLAYATEYPQHVAGVVFMSGTGLDLRWKAEYHAARDQRSERRSPMAYPPNMAVNRDGNRSYKAYLEQPGLRSRVAALKCPAIFVHGSEDLRPAWASREISSLMPNASFHLVEGAEHVIWLTHAPALRRLLRGFLASYASARAG